MLGRGAATERIRCGHRRNIFIERFGWVDDDKRVAGTLERPQLLVRFLGEDQQSAVCRAAGMTGKQSRRSIAEVQRWPQHNFDVVVVQLIGGSSDYPREVLGLDERQRDPDEKRAATDERSRAA